MPNHTKRIIKELEAKAGERHEVEPLKNIRRNKINKDFKDISVVVFTPLIAIFLLGIMIHTLN